MTYSLVEIRKTDFPEDARFVWLNDPNRQRRIRDLEREIAALHERRD